MNGAEYVVRTLQARGVERVYALCGNGLAPFFDACGALGMKVVDVRNEQSAAYMADVWGRMTGRLGVVAVSSGPGHTNALTGLANAWWDGGPLLLISGQSDDETRGLDHFQELDQVAMAAPVAKVARRVHHVTALGFMLDEAIAQATAQRPGPAHLTIPEDVFLAPLAEEPEPLPAAGPAQVQAVGPADPDLARRAVEMLAAAERPFLLVGSGAFYSGAWQPLRRLAEAADVPILTHIWDRGCIEEAIPQYVGVTNEELNGAMGALAEADLIIAVGARLDHRVGYARPPAVSPDVHIVRIDADPAELARGRRADLAIAAEPRAALEQMADLASQRGEWASAGWLAEVRAARSTPTAEGTPAPTPTPDANALADTLASGEVPYRLSIARTLAGRDDIPVERRAEMLVAALAAEVAAPSTEAPRIRDTYLSADGVLRLALVRGLAELGAEALPTVRQAAEGATGVAREHLLVARAYLGDAEAFPAVREVLRGSGDPVARMDAARALGVAGDAEAIPDLVGALEDPYRVEARDSLGEFTIYPVREQAVGALDALGVAVTRQTSDTFTVEGQ